MAGYFCLSLVLHKHFKIFPTLIWRCSKVVTAIDSNKLTSVNKYPSSISFGSAGSSPAGGKL
jgi:hypothetical protein